MSNMCHEILQCFFRVQSSTTKVRPHHHPKHKYPEKTGDIGVEKFSVAAKANPWYKDDKTHDFMTPTYGLKPGLVKEQLRKSIQELG